MKVEIPMAGETLVIACPPVTRTAEDDDALAAFARFLQSVPEVRAGRACWTRAGALYAGIEWRPA